MRLPCFSPLSLAAMCCLVFLSACDATFSTTEDTESTTANDECPALTADLANLPVAQEIRNNQLLQYFTPAQLADLRANSCLTKEADPAGASDRASGAKNRFWTPGTEIRVRFLNGSAALQQKVFACTDEWENYANVRFRQVTSGVSEVRVLFAEDGHWSYVGTDNRTIDACSETMSLQLTDQTPNGEIRRVALHEFGHVLGMLHEHQQPLASIPWNTSAVYAYYAQQDWTQQEVDEQVLNKNATESTQYTDFDASSIMQYPVAASLTTNGYSIPWNTQLSAKDKSFIGLMYATQRINIRHAATGYNANISFYLAGIYHTLRPGETLAAPALTGSNEFAIWEQSGSGWGWDEGYSPVYGKKYKIVRTGSGNDLTLAVD